MKRLSRDSNMSLKDSKKDDSCTVDIVDELPCDDLDFV
jgi:hypothetical protein